MPWKACCTMSLREEFVMLARCEGANVSALCRRFGVSRKCGYKWLGRFAAGGAGALADRSRRPRRSPRRSSEAVELAVAAARQEHPAWGPRKLRRLLSDQVAGEAGASAARLPSPSTIGRILLRGGLIDPAESGKHRAFVRFEKEHPNELWQMDFKGHVPMSSGGRCHPLTVLDDHSRFAVGVVACGDERTGTVRSSLVKLFERYGQPRRILCDNGAPWGTAGSGEPHSFLSVWLLLHGIQVSHGRPRHPQTQGKDERFHRTLDEELLSRHPLRDLGDSQRRFDEWRMTYNHVRPHEALGLAAPISRWRPSTRAYEDDPPPPQYPGSDAVRKVDCSGKLSFRGRCFKIGQAFAGQRVGLRACDQVDGMLKVMLGPHEVGTIRPPRHGDSPSAMEATAACCAEPPVATLPTARHSTQKSVTYVSEHV